MPADPVSLLAELVARPSPNPRGATPTPDCPGEAPVLEWLESFFRPFGASLIRQAVFPGRWNLLAELPSRHRGPALLLTAHADTVPAEGMTIPPFEPSIRNGRLYGRGSCDPKGGLAAMLAAIADYLAEHGGHFECPVAFAATCNEESGADGARRLAEVYGSTFWGAVVAEPTGLCIVNRHKGALRYRITIQGVAAHSSEPEKGVSALHAAAALLLDIEGPYRNALASRLHPALGFPRVSVGILQGGRQVNVVPDHAILDLDRRTLPGEPEETVRRELEARIAAVAQTADPRIRFSLQLLEQYPPLDLETEAPLSRLLAASCERTLRRAAFEPAHFGTDGGVFSEKGVPSLVFGPGSIRQAHTADEWIAIEEVRLAHKVYKSLLDLWDQMP